MWRKRVKFTVKKTKEFGIGFLYKNKNYVGGYYVKSGDDKSIYAIGILKNVERI